MAPAQAAASALEAIAPATAVTDALHGVTGKAGFSLAGLALIAAAYRMWRVGDVLRFIAPGSAIVGVGLIPHDQLTYPVYQSIQD